MHVRGLFDSSVPSLGNRFELLVNELQTVFGASHSVHQLKVNGEPGRFVRGGNGGEWVFEPGDFARNACANERVRYVLEVGLGSL